MSPQTIAVVSLSFRPGGGGGGGGGRPEGGGGGGGGDPAYERGGDARRKF